MFRLVVPFALASLFPDVPATAQDPGPKPTIPADTEVKTTASGLKYCVLEAGSKEGKRPKIGDTVKVHYTGWLPDGTVFDSSLRHGQPMSFQLGRVIEGWNEGVGLMTPGARFKLTIPPELGYGTRGAGGVIPPNATLIFEVQLLEVTEGKTPPAFAKPVAEKQQKTESGLKYEILGEGEGDAPKTGEMLELEYAFWTTDGKMLDWSGYQQQATKTRIEDLRLAFLKEALPMMKPGARWRCEVPPELSFGKEARGPLPPNSVTIWEVKLVRVIRPLAVPKFQASARESLKSTQSGLQYEVLQEGKGRTPSMGEEVTVHYAGWLTDGTLFDASYERGEPTSFRLGQVIQGWNEGLQLMKEGAIYQFTIPAALAYGKSGSPPKIGPDATLVFRVELISVK